MKKSMFIFCLWAASGICGPYELLELNSKPGALTGPVWQGDLSQIHAAYQRRDLKALWNVFHHALLSGLEPPKEEATFTTGYSKESIKRVNEIVRDYSGRLLSQIPGHAKYLGDGIDAIAARTDEQRPRNHYLELLAELGSDESLHEIGRFWDDERGRLPPEEEKIALQRLLEAMKRSDEPGIGFPSSVSSQARNSMWRAKVYYPWMKNGEKGSMPFSSQAEDKKIEDWWQSEVSAKYRQPINPTRQPPEEPPPQRLDMQALKQQAIEEKKEAAKSPLPLSQAPTPPPANEWPLILVTGTAVACLALLLWLQVRKKPR